jgi:hypothetical protein
MSNFIKFDLEENQSVCIKRKHIKRIISNELVPCRIFVKDIYVNNKEATTSYDVKNPIEDVLELLR